jgi:hypothetical protein
MADAQMMDRMFQRIMRGLVDTGRAPHHAELARALGCSVEDGRRLLHGVLQAYPIGWLHPDTDYIASFPPLNNQPTQYRVTAFKRRRAASERAAVSPSDHLRQPPHRLKAARGPRLGIVLSRGLKQARAGFLVPVPQFEGDGERSRAGSHQGESGGQGQLGRACCLVRCAIGLLGGVPGAAGEPLLLSDPEGVLVWHSTRIDDAGRLAMTRLDADLKPVWKAELPLSETDSVRQVATWLVPGLLVVVGQLQTESDGVHSRTPQAATIDLKTGALRTMDLAEK